MIQAALSGALDFSKGDPRDSMWLKKVYLITDAIETANIRKANELLYLQEIAGLSRTDIVGDDYKKISEATTARFRDILKAYFPWVLIDDKSATDRTAQAMGGSWELQYGKLEDPETQSRIAATVKEMLDRPLKAAQARTRKRQPTSPVNPVKGKARRRNARVR